MKSMHAMWMGVALAAAGVAGAGAASRDTITLTGRPWRVWMDEKAEWRTDRIYLPSERPPLAELPVNPPTGGWEALSSAAGMACTVPASVEEYFSGGKNFWTYHGVSWFWCDVPVPSAWKGRVVRLQVEKARMRAEVYVNGRLAGYDIVAETPFEADLSSFLDYGKSNRIAVRLTNPGGQRGWADDPGIPWGEVALPPSHDFTLLGGMTLVATGPVYIDDIFVKNLQPVGARKIEVQATMLNTTAASVTQTVAVSVRGTGVSDRREVDLAPGSNTVAFALEAPGADLWDVDSPALYDCEVELRGADGRVADRDAARFGFRVFEVKEGEGGHYFYLNGRRVRHKSAIDWGYYALTGGYATPEMAKRSVEAARAIGHNGINFHRCIGEPLVMKYADELGLLMYEEPGGFRAGGGYAIADNTLTARVMEEKCRRMTIRDRNHPSLVIFSLSNEDNNWNALRERVLRKIAALDGSRLVLNTSGSEFEHTSNDPQAKWFTYHIRPYETEIRRDYLDHHNAMNIGARFNEGAVFVGTHRNEFKDRVYYPGEVISTTGPSNWYLTAEMQKRLDPSRLGYDLNIYAGNRDKIAAAFRDWNMRGAGGGFVRGPGDVSTLAGSGMLYMMGRHAQSIMVNNTASGFAINGWSSGPQSTGSQLDWDSAMCDPGRHLKGRAEFYRHWVRPVQMALFRKNGKYFKPGDTVEMELHLINEAVISAGPAEMTLEVLDGAGQTTAFREERKLEVRGGEQFAQRLDPVKVTLDAAWRGGHITVRATLRRDGRVVAEGAEQVLLANRPSFQRMLSKHTGGAIFGWPAAEQALKDAGAAPIAFSEAPRRGRLPFIAAGEVPDEATLDAMLEQVRRGTRLLVRFDQAWAEALHARGLLSEPVTEWGGQQSPGWDGNGWGYLERFLGDQAIPGGTLIGTNGWEVPADPKGFYPFASSLPMRVHGLYVARPRIFNASAGPKEEERTLLVALGTLRHGRGRILLNAGYPVDENHAFNDMLFYGMLTERLD
jgi:beta-galactosidase